MDLTPVKCLSNCHPSPSFCGICINPDPPFWQGAALQDRPCITQPNRPFFIVDLLA
jgi:hypothetical protein